MSRRDDIYSSSNGQPQRRQPARRDAASGPSSTARQNFAQGQQRGSSGGRLSYEDQLRSGRSSQARPSASDYSRERYTGSQPQRQGARAQQPVRQAPRGNQQIAQQRGQTPQRAGRPAAPANAAGRYNRNNGAYQARPNQAVVAAQRAEGALSTPISFVVRLALVVVLVAVFGIRMVVSGGDAGELKKVQETVASQQQQLDTLTAENEAMQSSIDSRQATIDAYNALL